MTSAFICSSVMDPSARMEKPAIHRIRERISSEIFDRKLMDNQMRGVWCEFMVAEALGPSCSVVSHGWHPWDLQIGAATAEFPERILIQVRNTARTQPWNKPLGIFSSCKWKL